MYAAMCTTPQQAIQTTAFSQAPPLKTFLKIGYAPFAVLARAIFRPPKTNQAEKSKRKTEIFFCFFLYFCTFAP